MVMEVLRILDGYSCTDVCINSMTIHGALCVQNKEPDYDPICFESILFDIKLNDTTWDNFDYQQSDFMNVTVGDNTFYQLPDFMELDLYSIGYYKQLERDDKHFKAELGIIQFNITEHQGHIFKN